MISLATDIPVVHDAPIPTWFGVGGHADALARPRSHGELLACVRADPTLRVLGDGANLLVDDPGVAELVVTLADGTFSGHEIGPKRGGVVRVRAGAGVRLPRLVSESVRLGLAGLDGLAGIPASIGGALVMNAGGAFGQISDVVLEIEGVDRAGRDVRLERDHIAFAYRSSGLHDLIVTGCTLGLREGDASALRRRMLEVMEYKKQSQPLAAHSAGCCYKNPTLARPVPGVGEAGARVSAGMLIDRAGCKGLCIGGARVSERHANFFTVGDGARARDVIELMELVELRVRTSFGVSLEREVVVWRREGR